MGRTRTNEELDAAIVVLLKKGALQRVEIAAELETQLHEVMAACDRLVERGQIAEKEIDGFVGYELVPAVTAERDGGDMDDARAFGLEIIAQKEKDAAERAEDVRPIADRRLLRRITPARRAELNAQDAEDSREEAAAEDLLHATKERLKVIHERRMNAARASTNDTEYADVPCKEILRFSTGLAFTVRCDAPEEWPEGTADDGVVGDPRTLTAEDMQTQLPLTDGGALDMEKIAAICGADGAEEGPPIVVGKGKGRKGSKKGGAKGGAK